MGKTTGIAWTDHTFNTHWGCDEVSPGCDNCYAKAWAKRTGAELWGPTAKRRMFGDQHWAAPAKWNRDAERAGVRARVFCSSMADVFEDRRDLDAVRAHLWTLIEATPWLDWLLLTKRPANIREMLPAAWLEKPQRNVWLGTTVEDQKRAEERIPLLLDVPAAVRFLSCEPLLEGVDLTFALSDDSVVPGAQVPAIGMIDWVIVGGESGGGARPFGMRWAERIVEDCHTAGTAVFVKQMGARPTIETQARAEQLVKLRSRKGDDMNEWPASLRVRQFPEVRP